MTVLRPAEVSLRRLSAGGVVSLTGLALLAVPAYDVWEDLTALDWPVAATLVENAALFALAIGLVAGGAWVATRDWEATYAETVARWTVGGALLVGGLFSVVVLMQAQVMDATKPTVLALDGALIGASASFGAGLVRANQRRSDHARDEGKRRERRLELVNRLLRHSLANDLNVVQAKAGALGPAVEGDPDAERDLDVLQSRTGEMAEFVTAMRTLMDAVVEDATPTLDPVSLLAVLDEQVAAVDEAAPAATVELADPPDPGVEVRGEVLLAAVFENLLRNAVQHADSADPTVRVTTERVALDDAPAVRVAVADDGPGIDDAEKRRVLDRGVTSGSPGGGFGLYLVSELVALAGGEVDIADNEPRGTVVTVTLPLAA